MLLEGSAVAEIDGERHALKPQDTTFIPANLPHRFINSSDAEPMKILWIYASVDATRTLIATGNTRGRTWRIYVWDWEISHAVRQPGLHHLSMNPG